MNLFLWPFLLGLMAALVILAGYLFLFLRTLTRAAGHIAEDGANGSDAPDPIEEAQRYREAAERDLMERGREMSRREARMSDSEEAFEARSKNLAEREAEFAARKSELADREKQLETQIAEVAGMSSEQAVAKLIERVENTHREKAQARAREIEFQAIAEAEMRARSVLLEAMERSAVSCVAEATVSVIPIASEDVKGRLIGREGRNIRSFEQTTGVDLIVDDTPEAVVVSCFDPVRREVARVTLVNLIADGRIHPARIEELHAKAQAEVEASILEAGRGAVETAQVAPLEPGLLETLGRLRFRTSYAQNVLDHSMEVSRMAGIMAVELGLDATIAKRAGLLHDIGKALSPEHEGPHALTGMEYLLSRGESEAVARAVGSHHGETEGRSPEGVLISVADALSASRPGSRKENMEGYVRRLTELERLANGFAGVDRSYAIQSGREIRILVKPEEVDDRQASALADEIARRIEKELQYPGQIKVTVIRETRAQDVAK
jgi:ribonuclease Y